LRCHVRGEANAYRILVGKAKGMGAFWRFEHRRE